MFYNYNLLISGIITRIDYNEKIISFRVIKQKYQQIESYVINVFQFYNSLWDTKRKLSKTSFMKHKLAVKHRQLDKKMEK